jgi:uncharacterized protein (TIGR03085 family)
MRRHALHERMELAETLRETDQDAPTLCGDWTTAQLAAHLVLRERSLTEVLGRIPSDRTQGVAQRAIDSYVARTPYREIVAAVASGPPPWSPFALAPVRETVNLLEYLVHHEDVRRAVVGWVPRVMPTQRQESIWSRLRVGAKLTLRSVPVPLRLVWPEHGDIAVGRAGSGGPQVTLTGEPEELALVAFGRQRVAKVEYSGPPDAVESVRNADIAV